MDEIMQELYDYARVNGLRWMICDLEKIRERLDELGTPVKVKDRILEDCLE